jgi:hypothetical protein
VPVSHGRSDIGVGAVMRWRRRRSPLIGGLSFQAPVLSEGQVMTRDRATAGLVGAIEMSKPLRIKLAVNFRFCDLAYVSLDTGRPITRPLGSDKVSQSNR